MSRKRRNARELAERVIRDDDRRIFTQLMPIKVTLDVYGDTPRRTGHIHVNADGTWEWCDR